MLSEIDQHNLELIRELDKLIDQGQWEGSLFYQAIGKKLRDFSEQLKKDFDFEAQDFPSTPLEMREIIKQKSGFVEVYISVYCTEGRNIKKWEVILANLYKQVISRPIYKRQKDIKDVVNAKANPINDAYVFAYVTEMDILKPSFREKVLLDRYGHELLRLKENSLRPENITKLVHVTGEYSFHKNTLVRLEKLSM